MKVAKADLVPKDTNLLGAYASFADLEAACEAFCAQVNAREHRVTRRAPDVMLAEERLRSHPVPAKIPMVTFEAGQYSVPHELLGANVWVRVHGRGTDEQVIIVHVGATGPVEVARHARAMPGSPQMLDAHFPPAPPGALGRVPLTRTVAEAAFLSLGDGARVWLAEAAAAGTTKMRVKMAQAVELAKLFSRAEVDWALGHAAVLARFAEADLASILDHHHTATAAGPVSQAGEDRSLTQGTAGWATLGTATAAEVSS